MRRAPQQRGPDVDDDPRALRVQRLRGGQRGGERRVVVEPGERGEHATAASPDHDPVDVADRAHHGDRVAGLDPQQRDPAADPERPRCDAADRRRASHRARQPGPHFECGLRPRLRLLREAAEHQLIELVGHRPPLAYRRRPAHRVLVLDRAPLADERRSPDQHLERDDAERVEVGAVIHRRPAAELLGGEVVHGPDHRADLREAGHRRLLGEAEVDQPHAARPDHHVLRLQIAVHDPCGVDRGQPRRELIEQPEDLAEPAALAGARHPRREGLPGEKLHDDVRPAVDHAAAVERGRPRPADRAQHLGLELEPHLDVALAPAAPLEDRAGAIVALDHEHVRGAAGREVAFDPPAGRWRDVGRRRGGLADKPGRTSVGRAITVRWQPALAPWTARHVAPECTRMVRESIRGASCGVLRGKCDGTRSMRAGGPPR